MYDDQEAPMSTWDWFWTIFLLGIPLVNVILTIVWACGVGNVNRVNFCRAYLLWMVVVISLTIIFWATIIHLLVAVSAAK